MYDIDCPWRSNNVVGRAGKCEISNNGLECLEDRCPTIKTSAKQKFISVQLVIKIASIMDRLREIDEKMNLITRRLDKLEEV